MVVVSVRHDSDLNQDIGRVGGATTMMQIWINSLDRSVTRAASVVVVLIQIWIRAATSVVAADLF